MLPKRKGVADVRGRHSEQVDVTVAAGELRGNARVDEDDAHKRADLAGLVHANEDPEEAPRTVVNECMSRSSRKTLLDAPDLEKRRDLVDHSEQAEEDRMNDDIDHSVPAGTEEVLIEGTTNLGFLAGMSLTVEVGMSSSTRKAHMNSLKREARMNSTVADTCSQAWEAGDDSREHECPWVEGGDRTVWDLPGETRKMVRHWDQLLDSSRRATDACNDWVVCPSVKEASRIVQVLEIEDHVEGSSDCAGLFLTLETCHMVMQPLGSAWLLQHFVHHA